MLSLLFNSSRILSHLVYTNKPRLGLLGVTQKEREREGVKEEGEKKRNGLGKREAEGVVVEKYLEEKIPN